MQTTVLISGRGSNLHALHRGAKTYSIGSVVSDNPRADGLRWATHQGLKTTYVDKKAFSSKEEFNSRLLLQVQETAPDLIILAGFMSILSQAFVSAYSGRILNIHPSLLPKYPGLRTHERALAAKDLTHGCTVHVVDEGLDTGLSLAQAAVSVLEDDTASSLADRTLVQEHRLFCWVVNAWATGDIRVDSGQVLYSEAVKRSARELGFVLNDTLPSSR